MARLRFPDAGSRWAVDVTGKPAVSHTYTVYADAAATTPASILADVDGTPDVPIPGSQVVTDGYGFLPYWWGPDSVDRLWVYDGVVAAWPVDADNNARIDAVAARVAAIETGTASGLVISVAGRSGEVVLSAADVTGVETPTGAQAKADAAQANAIAAAASDPRLADDRYPLHHAASHAAGGLDPVTIDQAQVNGLAATFATKADLVLGKIPTSQIPAVAINTTFTVASQAAMLALSATQGDVAIRTDFTPAHAYQLAAADPTVLSNWIQVSLGAVTTVNGQTGVVVLGRADVGLGSVDNTADADKPVSTATQTALNLKAPLASPTFTGTVAGVTAAMVGLGNVDNTSDANKPVSTAQAAAINSLKTPGNGVVAVNEAPVTPLQYGAVGNGSNSDDAAFAAMLAALPSQGAHVHIPARYNFLLSAPIVLTGNAHWSGGGANARITNHSSDVFTVTSNLAWMRIHDFRIDSSGGGGHIFAFGALGASKSQIDHMVLIQNVANKSILQSAFWLDNVFNQNQLFGAVNRSVPMVNLVSTTDNLSDNTFEDLTLTDASGASTWAMWLEEQYPALAFSNKIRGCNFENPVGGCITMRGHINYDIEDIEAWDVSGPAANHMIYLRAGGGSGLPNRGGSIRNYCRPSTSGGLGTGIQDIAMGPVGSEYDTVIRGCHGSGSNTILIDLQHNIGCRVEDCTLISLASSYAPIYTVQASAGTGATAALDPNASNLLAAGCLLTTGTSPAAGNLVAVSANANGWLSAAPAAVLLAPRNAAAAQAQLYVAAQSATGFTVACANTPPASTQLKFSYSVVRSING